MAFIGLRLDAEEEKVDFVIKLFSHFNFDRVNADEHFLKKSPEHFGVVG